MTTTVTVTNPGRLPRFADLPEGVTFESDWAFDRVGPKLTVALGGIDRADVTPNLLDDLFGSYDNAEVS